MERDFIKKKQRVVCEGESVKFTFIAEMDVENDRKPRAERFPVRLMCEMLEVSRQGYYAWKKRAPSARQKEDVTLTTLIVAIHKAHQGPGTAARPDSRGPGPERVPGQPEAGTAPGPGRWPAMRAPAAVQDHDGAGSGERVRPGRPGRPRLCYRGRKTSLVVRGISHAHFHDERLGLPGYGYRRVFTQGSGAGPSLIICARNWSSMRSRMAVENRRPGTGEVVFHSDRGSQYTGRAFRDVCLGSWYHTVGRAEQRHMLRQ